MKNDFKILFITSTRLGDAILSTGLLKYLHKTYPDGKITVACGPLPKTLFEGFPNVSNIIAMKKEKHHGHWVKLTKQTFSTKWDLVIDLRNSAVSRILRAKQRHIFGNQIDKNVHKVVQNSAVIGLNEPQAPQLYFTEAQHGFANDLIPGDQATIAVGPSANWIGKTWPTDRFVEVIKWLTATDGAFPDANVAVFAAPSEEAQAQPVLDSIPIERQINGIAKGNPAEVAAALSKCVFYLGNDSGLMHAAAAVNVPTVGVFGPSHPSIYSPWGNHTAYACTPETFDELINFEGYDPKTLKRTLMNSLTVETVKQTISEFLSKA